MLPEAGSCAKRQFPLDVKNAVRTRDCDGIETAEHAEYAERD